MKRILFLCPHNAAKSVLAAAYFNKRVTYLGVEARAFSAGTEPDDAVSAHVATLLDERGYGRSEHKPRRVKRADFEEADQIISIGCDLRDLPETDKKNRAVGRRSAAESKLGGRVAAGSSARR